MSHANARGPRWLRAVAVVAAATFGCATVRSPASTMVVDVPVENGRTTPQLELWVESNRAVSPEEAAAAAAETRAALSAALADRAGPGEDLLLVVRAQGVTRTSGRRSDQKAAMVGLVVGAVVIVAAVVVVAIISGHGGGGGGGGGGAARAVGAVARGGGHGPAPSLTGRVPAGAGPHPVRVASAVAPRPPPPGPRPPPGQRPPPPGGTALPRPAIIPDHEPAWTFNGGLDVNVGSSPYQEETEQPIPMVLDEGAWEEAPPPEPAALQVMALEPPPPLAIERRGFFQGDSLLLELLLVDRLDGRPLWRKTIERDVDPRSSPDVRALVDEALAKGTWTPL